MPCAAAKLRIASIFLAMVIGASRGIRDSSSAIRSPIMVRAEFSESEAAMAFLFG